MTQQKHTKIQIHAPELTETIIPAFQLHTPANCPTTHNGYCYKCPHFLGSYTRGESITSSGTYTGACGYEE